MEDNGQKMIVYRINNKCLLFQNDESKKYKS
jgi:hypothetical protein